MVALDPYLRLGSVVWNHTVVKTYGERKHLSYIYKIQTAKYNYLAHSPQTLASFKSPASSISVNPLGLLLTNYWGVNEWCVGALALERVASAGCGDVCSREVGHS